MTDPFRIRPLDEFDSLEPEQASFGTLNTLLGHLPLKAMRIHGRLSGLSFRLVLSQTFHNLSVHNLEAVYIFPLPSRAAVTRFLMRTRDREVVGRLKERGRARQDYARAIRAGHQAALLEEDRPEVFNMKVGNIPAGESVEVELELAGPLTMADGMATFRFPLVVAPRYIPGRELGGENVGEGVCPDTDATPDASRISPPVLLPGYPNPVRLSIELQLEPGFEMNEFYSSLPQLKLHDGTLRLDPSTNQLNRDLVLRLPVLGHDVQGCIQQVQDQGGKAFTWSLTLLPPAEQAAPVPRNLVVLIDRSGSMSGWKMAGARRSAGRIIDSFRDHDRFAVLTFDNLVEDLSDGRLVTASDAARYRAMQRLDQVEARGGTELAPALVQGLQRLQQAPDGVKYLILITDGQVGNQDQILREIHARGQGVRIFCVGIDEAVNAGFLEAIAQHSGGTCELVHGQDQLEQSMQALRRRLVGPVLRQVEVEAPRQSAPELAPTAVDLFPGLPARLYGRTLGALPKRVWVRGRHADGQPWRRQFPVQTVQQAPFRQLWAREVVLELEHGFVTGREALDYKSENITRFSLAHNVLCRFTAFVAVDESSQVQGNRLLQVVQPVELPAGWEQPTSAGSGNHDIADLLCDRSARSPIVDNSGPRCVQFGPISTCETRVNTSDALESLAKRKPTKVAEMLKSTWLGDSPRDWRQCLKELQQAGQLDRQRTLLKELLRLLCNQLPPELLARGYQLLLHGPEASALRAWTQEVQQLLDPAARSQWWR